MALLRGCQEGKQTPELKEIECPKCKEIIEVFVKEGKAVEDVKCEKCGFEIKEGDPV